MSVLENRSVFKGEMLTSQGADGRFMLVVVVKGTYLVDAQGQLSIAPEQDAIHLEDEFHGEPGESSLKKASDISLFKASTDVGLVGSACAPQGKQVMRMPVEIAVGSLRKRLVVFGDRVWNSRLGAITMSDPKPFSSIPLVYERAFGGKDADQQEERNPVGVGFRLNRPDSGSPLPNIEDPDDLISSWSDRPTPQNFGFVPGNWSPRKEFVGTYDAQWKQDQFPLPPRDFDARYFLAAHADLRCAPYLRGDESVEVMGASPQGPWRFSLPAISIALSVQFRTGNAKRRLAALDTLTLYPNENKLSMVWRHAIVCPERILDVKTVTAFPLRLSTLKRLSRAPA